MTLTSLNAEIVSCRKCPRLVQWREEVARVKRKAYRDWDYWGRPVPGFGDQRARVLVVGLAPGAHGSNRTGRMFTGDGSGDFLYPALFRAGFANQPNAKNRDDGLQLKDIFITAVCRCAPPENKPARDEIVNCEPYLLKEMELFRPKVIVALGRIAFDRIVQIYYRTMDDGSQAARRPLARVFKHNAHYQLPTGNWLLCSYHPSQQNTLTGKLTAAMFDKIWTRARELLESA
jgi:uracil-DNA glycosylase family 4